MKLRFTPNPDYIHKVLVVAHEAGVMDRIEVVPTYPFDADCNLSDDNPLGKVPTLILDSGEALYGGPVICEYLDSLHDGPKMFPAAGWPRFRALRQQALAEGLFDSLTAMDLERRRTGEQRIDHVERLWGKVVRGLDEMDEDVPTYQPLTIGAICTAGVLSRIDYRIGVIGGAPTSIPADYQWRGGRPALAALYDNVRKRPSMQFVVPRAR